MTFKRSDSELLSIHTCSLCSHNEFFSMPHDHRNKTMRLWKQSLVTVLANACETRHTGSISDILMACFDSCEITLFKLRDKIEFCDILLYYILETGTRTGSSYHRLIQFIQSMDDMQPLAALTVNLTR